VRVHLWSFDEIPNLYLAGPGIFATAGASNPTYTIFALFCAAPNSSPQTGVRSPIDALNPARTGAHCCSTNSIELIGQPRQRRHSGADPRTTRGGPRQQIAATVFDSYAPQLDLSFAAAVYGLAGLFLGSLMGELLAAALFPRHRFARGEARTRTPAKAAKPVAPLGAALLLDMPQVGGISAAGPWVRIRFPPRQ
jgi:hypothetical protein